MNLSNGFQRKQFTDIKKEIEQSLTNVLGEINLIAPSIFANIVAIFAEREANIWEQIEAVYNSSYPQTAEGYSLDSICALNGVIRSDYTYSTAICQLTALNYTKISKNSTVEVKNTSNLFALAEDITVANEKCCSIKIEINTNNKEHYDLVINEELLTYKKTKESSKEDIAKELALIIEQTNADISVIVEENKLTLKAIDYLNEFSCFVSEGIKILECTCNGYLIATKKGSIPAPANSLCNIHTPISGWISVNNISAANIGNDIETDQELRARRELSIKLGGSGTLEALRANLLNLNTVTAVTIIENTTDQFDKDGIPPHSFKTLITGGNDADIARVIWQKKPAGIATFGEIGVSTQDSTNKTHIINFSRPIKRFIHAKITITKTKDFIEGSQHEIKNKLIAQINKLGVNSNVILKSLFLSIFCEQGIANAIIELGGTIRDSIVPKLSENDIKIKDSEVAFTDFSKIEILLQDF